MNYGASGWLRCVRATDEPDSRLLLAMVLGVAAAFVLVTLVVAADTRTGDLDEDRVGHTIRAAIPALIGASLLLAWALTEVPPGLRLGLAFTALGLVTLYPFLLTDSPWWAIGLAMALHVLALILRTAPPIRIGIAVLGMPLLIQAAYRADLGPYNPLVAGLALGAHQALLWLLLPDGAWRRVPNAALLAGTALLGLAALYSLTQALEWDRAAAAAASALLAAGLMLLPRSRLSGASISGIPVPPIPGPAKRNS